MKNSSERRRDAAHRADDLARDQLLQRAAHVQATRLQVEQRLRIDRPDRRVVPAPTLSVVICTVDRPVLLRRSIAAIAALGVWHIAASPAIFGALSPLPAAEFLLGHPAISLFVIGSVFLTVTGAAICAAVAHDLAVAEYTALQVKQAVVGHGKAAKEQVQQMVKILLNLAEPAQADASDALAVAICHANSAKLAKRLKG